MAESGVAGKTRVWLKNVPNSWFLILLFVWTFLFISSIVSSVWPWGSNAGRSLYASANSGDATDSSDAAEAVFGEDTPGVSKSFVDELKETLTIRDVSLIGILFTIVVYQIKQMKLKEDQYFTLQKKFESVLMDMGLRATQTQAEVAAALTSFRDATKVALSNHDTLLERIAGAVTSNTATLKSLNSLLHVVCQLKPVLLADDVVENQSPANEVK